MVIPFFDDSFSDIHIMEKSETVTAKYGKQMQAA